jgi:hypothetical protein
VRSRADRETKPWIELALLPQAGVAIGMALVASSHLPEHRKTLLSIVIGSTVFFEIIGPVFTRLAIKRTEEGLTRPQISIPGIYCGIRGLQFLIVTRPCSKLPREYSLKIQVLVAGS